MRSVATKTPWVRFVMLFASGAIISALIVGRRDHAAVSKEAPKHPIVLGAPAVGPGSLERARLIAMCAELARFRPFLTWRANRVEFAYITPDNCFEAVAVASPERGGEPVLYVRPIPRLSRPLVDGNGGGLFYFEDPIPISAFHSTPTNTPSDSTLRTTTGDGY